MTEVELLLQVDNTVEPPTNSTVLPTNCMATATIISQQPRPHPMVVQPMVVLLTATPHTVAQPMVVP